MGDVHAVYWGEHVFSVWTGGREQADTKGYRIAQMQEQYAGSGMADSTESMSAPRKGQPVAPLLAASSSTYWNSSLVPTRSAANLRESVNFMYEGRMSGIYVYVKGHNSPL